MTFLYCLFWVILLKIVWMKRQNFFWPVFVGIIATPFVGTLWAIMLEDQKYGRRLFRD